jgi:hypothetical protein
MKKHLLQAMSAALKTIHLSVDDKACVRRSVAISRNAGAASTSKKGGFGALIANLVSNRLQQIKAENDGTLRYAAIIGKKYTLPQQQVTEKPMSFCVICFDQPICMSTTVAQPCAHAFACTDCVKHMKGMPCAICRAPVDSFGAAVDGKVYDSGTTLDDNLLDVIFVTKKAKYVDRCVVLRNTDDIKAALTDFCKANRCRAPVSAIELASKSPSLFWSLVANISSSSAAESGEKFDGDVEDALMDAQRSIMGRIVESAAKRSRQSD